VLRPARVGGDRESLHAQTISLAWHDEEGRGDALTLSAPAGAHQGEPPCQYIWP
jgi:hypothetical protein